MSPKIDIITIAANDLERTRQFYERGFGGSVGAENGAITVSLGSAASPLALRPWDAVALDAGVEAVSSGFRGFTLSYILDSADGVDQILARAERHGGRVSKPPKNAVWGYSAYVTDPNGHLWKIASSKRRPLIARGATSSHDGRPIRAQEVPITIGVADMKRAKRFYRDGLGLEVKKDYRRFVMFSGGDDSSDLGMYERGALADDAAVPPEGSGFRGFSITHVVDSPNDVDALLARATRAGGSIVKAAVAADRAGYGGYFSDPDGNLWQVAARN
jgi:catechol 2,3-dioxygenase-like lactoylglutathione lyase family enzyme